MDKKSRDKSAKVNQPSRFLFSARVLQAAENSYLYLFALHLCFGKLNCENHLKEDICYSCRVLATTDAQLMSLFVYDAPGCTLTLTDVA
jgi:hypothetical protein